MMRSVGSLVKKTLLRRPTNLPRSLHTLSTMPRVTGHFSTATNFRPSSLSSPYFVPFRSFCSDGVKPARSYEEIKQALDNKAAKVSWYDLFNIVVNSWYMVWVKGFRGTTAGFLIKLNVVLWIFNEFLTGVNSFDDRVKELKSILWGGKDKDES